MNKLDSIKDKLIIAWHFISARYRRFATREQLEKWQAKQLQGFLQTTANKASYYKTFTGRHLMGYPLMDKQSMMQNFSARNTAAVELQTIQSIAMQAENSRDFNPTWQSYTVGLSSGTSGQRGVFLVSKKERLRWAGILLARTLPNKFLWQILQFWKPRLRIAFFLRANSNLYNTLHSSRIDFRFYDLLKPLSEQLNDLHNFQPQALVAPASILQAIARQQNLGKLQINPERIINVAEVLETEIAEQLEKTFQQKIHQIYQATEGFLGRTCEEGRLHLNETYIHIEKNWLDKGQTRFQPVITDFTRTTQLIIRYQLNDILRPAKDVCRCGNPEIVIDAIEGRSDEIFWLPDFSQQLQAVYPDTLRRCMMIVEPALDEYKITQRAMRWDVAIKTRGDSEECKINIQQAINQLCTQQQLSNPELQFSEWQTASAGSKRRRLVCERRN